MIPIPRGTLKAIKQYVESHSTGQSPEEAIKRVVARYEVLEKEQPWIGGKANVLWDKMYGSWGNTWRYEINPEGRTEMIRYHTVASGDEYCDFWQVGDKSQAWIEADKDKLK